MRACHKHVEANSKYLLKSPVKAGQIFQLRHESKGVRAQGHSAAVKEAVSASLLGCKAPFRLVQDHSRSGRLEASTLALRKWLFSDQFDRYLSLVQVQSLLPVYSSLLD